MALANIIEDDIHTPNLRAFDIEYPSENLGVKAQQYQLETALISGRYEVDLTRIESLFHQIPLEEKNEALEQLFVLIATWPLQMTFEDFCVRVNQCVEQWVTATQSNTHITTITNLLRCLGVSNDHLENSALFHLYLFEILSESIHLFEHHQIHYLLNH
ncbi:MAG: hypothetical protein B7Y32_08915 [Methylophilales bacterium 16-45-7]|nr:MAG: hypothetical protein B7Y32_08915 [Methylophilales bacterium 16-45-7]